jgi:hypothetical protein
MLADSSPMPAMVSPMVVRSSASPLTRRCSVTRVVSSCPERSPTTVRTWLRLVIISPITWSRSASVEVSRAVLDNRLSMVPPSPWKTEMIWPLSALTSCGSRNWNSGWKPLNSRVRSSAGVVWSRSKVYPTGSARPARSGACSAM